MSLGGGADTLGARRRFGAMDDLQSELRELRARLSDTLERL